MKVVTKRKTTPQRSIAVNCYMVECIHRGESKLVDVRFDRKEAERFTRDLNRGFRGTKSRAFCHPISADIPSTSVRSRSKE